MKLQSVDHIAQTFALQGCQVVALPVALAPADLQVLGAVKGLDLGTGRRVDLVVVLKP